MDPTVLTVDPRALAGPIATLAAAGSAVTVLTEVTKTYMGDRVPPPMIAALIAALFTMALVASQYDELSRRDAFPILLTWFGLFQLSIGVYHGAKLAFGQATKDAAAEHLAAVHTSYEKLLAAKDRQLGDKDRQLVEQRSMIQVVPLPVPTTAAPAPDTLPVAEAA